MIKVGLCTSSRSERHLMEALWFELCHYRDSSWFPIIEVDSYGNTDNNEYYDCDVLIIPADRSEMTQFALKCFYNNIPFCHYLAGSRSYSFTHDDINRQMISLMANFCFAESPEAKKNLIEMGIPEDRILVTGTSHFDGVTMQDIEEHAVPYSPRPYDLILVNPETMFNRAMNYTEINKNYIKVRPNEDAEADYKQWSHLEFLYLLHNADNFISNSSAGHYELPYLQKYYGSRCKWINPSQRNKERTPIPPEYCRGASKIIADWCNKVDLEWLRTPKRLFEK